MSNLSQNVAHAAFRVHNGYAPGDGPKAVPITLDFTAATKYGLDFLKMFENGQVPFFQSVYIDNSANSSALTVTSAHGTNQAVTCPPNSQGYFPILSMDPPKFDVSLPSGAGNNATLLQFLTMPMPAQVWSTLAGSGPSSSTPVTPSKGTLTDASGTIAAGGTAQVALAANAARQYLFIENTDTTNLWVNFTTAAVQSEPSLELFPGSSFVMEAGFISTEAISVIGPTTGKGFTIKWA